MDRQFISFSFSLPSTFNSFCKKQNFLRSRNQHQLLLILSYDSTNPKLRKNQGNKKLFNLQTGWLASRVLILYKQVNEFLLLKSLFAFIKIVLKTIKPLRG
jgi:hypothetical protein